MPGMNSGLNVGDPTVVAAFRAALLHQGLLALLVFVLIALAWVTLREFFGRRGSAALAPALAAAPAGGEAPAPEGAAHQGSVPAAGSSDPAPLAAAPKAFPAQLAEPGWRHVLRIAFAALWILDGLLQAQPKMAGGLPSQVIEPTAANSPPWVQHVVNWAGTAWSYHPIQAGASAVWIQVGIGVWLLVAPRGFWSRVAGLVSAGWGLLVWVFGESFGGIFAPGLTWLFGAPGAVMWYSVAGLAIALPERYWYSRRLGQLASAGTGLFLLGMAVLQAWPGRGFWRGTSHGQAGTLTSMVQSMSGTSQPRLLSALLANFAIFSAGNGFLINLLVVVALAAIGGAFLSQRPRLIRPALVVLAILSLAVWILIQDLGFLGGLGTDPNSMAPGFLIALGGYLALSQDPVPATRTTEVRAPARASGLAAWQRASLARLRAAAAPRALASTSFRSVAAIGAVGMIVLGAAPMAAAQSSPVASTILAQAINGAMAPIDFKAPDFTLVNQDGKTVSLSSLRGKVVLLTFLDPVCTSDCAFTGIEFRLAARLLAARSRQIEFVAVDYNPLYLQRSYLVAFDRETNLVSVPNWQYLTGTKAQLEAVWKVYGSPLEVLPAGAMVAHGETAFAIDQTGHVRYEMNFAPGPGTAATESSLAAELVTAAQQLLK